MGRIEDLIDEENPALPMIYNWVAAAANPCEILPPSPERASVLIETKVSTRSTMGAFAYETGGVLVDGGWLRFLGSGHPRLKRTLSWWNKNRSEGFYLVADDVVGGFFAINGGGLGGDVGKVYYWGPDALDWMPLEIGFTDFFVWSLSDRLGQFYESLRWPTWKEDLDDISGDECFSFYPFLWTEEGGVARSLRQVAPVTETFDLKRELADKLRARE